MSIMWIITSSNLHSSPFPETSKLSLYRGMGKRALWKLVWRKRGSGQRGIIRRMRGLWFDGLEVGCWKSGCWGVAWEGGGVSGKDLLLRVLRPVFLHHHTSNIQIHFLPFFHSLIMLILSELGNAEVLQCPD